MAHPPWKSMLSPEQKARLAQDRADHIAILVAQRLLRTKAELSPEELAAVQAKLERWTATARPRRRPVT